MMAILRKPIVLSKFQTGHAEAQRGRLFRMHFRGSRQRPELYILSTIFNMSETRTTFERTIFILSVCGQLAVQKVPKIQSKLLKQLAYEFKNISGSFLLWFILKKS